MCEKSEHDGGKRELNDGLTAKIRSDIQGVLLKIPQIRKAVLFGSRAMVRGGLRLALTLPWKEKS